jgi:hypothetical protein
MHTEHSAKSAYLTVEDVALEIYGAGGLASCGVSMSTVLAGTLKLNSWSSFSSKPRSRLVISAFVVNDEMSTVLELVISIGPLLFKA